MVGIGASAGGLEALRTLLAHLPLQSGLSFVIAQHLSPNHESMLVPLLTRETALPVRPIADGLEPRPDTVYITPARTNVILRDRRLHLSQATAPGTPKPSIDAFFGSLAEELGEAAIAVVLSGTGSDGARGIREVRAAGGATFAQDESARYNGMPHAAIDSGCVDFVLAPQEIAAKLGAIAASGGVDAAPEADDDPDKLERIFALVRSTTGVDFRLYKSTTVSRRIHRRMAATECPTPVEYLRLLSIRRDEVRRLAQEILISVTAFFRDADAFDALAHTAADVIRAKQDDEDIRIWVAGCATGEEAYSVAMLFHEAIERAGRRLRLQIFATDIDAGALVKARRGVYPATEMGAVNRPRVRRFFSHTGDFIQALQPLRDSILFSAHDLMRDPPFLRLDLICCRNVLIYFKSHVQARLLKHFHAALRPGGSLFLGRSETTYLQDALFAPAAEHARIFRRVEGPAAAQRPYPPPGQFPARMAPALAHHDSLPERVLQAIQGVLLPAAVVVDDAMIVRHVYGEVSDYIALRPGEANLNLQTLAPAPLGMEIRSMLVSAQREPDRPLTHTVRLPAPARPVRVVVLALAREEERAQRQFLVAFQRVERTRRPRAPDTPAPAAADGREELEQELASTRQYLQTVIQELETSNEELQSLNEELSSANEELQSANEELETSNEELQSTNEELTTVNEELESKTQELARLNTHLRNVEDSLLHPLVVIDEHLRVTISNPRAADIFTPATPLPGQNLFSLPCHLPLGELRPAIEAVVADGRPFQHQFESEVSYRLHVHPYVDETGRHRGAVLTFVDNTAMLRAQRAIEDGARRLEASERFAMSTIDSLPQHLCVLDAAGDIVAVNAAWNRFRVQNGGTSTRCATGTNYPEVCQRALLAGDASAGRFLAGLREVMDGRSPSFTIEYPCHGPDARRWFLAHVSPFSTEGPPFYIITHVDITAQKEREEMVDLQSRALEGSSNGIMITEARDGSYPLVYVNRAFQEITGYRREEVLGRDCRFLQGPDMDQPGLDEIRAALGENRDVRVLLRNYRKDGSRFWNELSIYPIRTDGDPPRFYVGVQRDMTANVVHEEAARAAAERERRALAFAGIGIFTWDVNGGRVNASDIMLRLLGRNGGNGVLDHDALHDTVHPDDRNRFEEALRLCLAGHVSLDIEYRVVWPDGDTHWLHSRGDIEADGTGLPGRILCLTQDISARHESEERVRFSAHHDTLTGLPNRALLRDRLQQALNQARRQGTHVAVVFIDLDHFKHVNDSLGHHVGDQVLQAVARRLQAITRDTDTLCRYSGDEYIVVLPNLGDAGEAGLVAEKIVHGLSDPYDLAGVEIVVTPSVGVALFPDDADQIDALMKNADVAMYHAKDDGRSNYKFFKPQMINRERDRLTIAGGLRRALDRGELLLHYQPQVRVEDGAVLGLEALVHWMHPDRGLVLPGDFIPYAEDQDLVVRIGDFVLREACRQASAWRREGLPVPPIAVNFSAAQLRQRNLPQSIATALRDHAMPPESIEVELTESTIVANLEQIADTLSRLHGLGIPVALDDFGSGYSGLQHLRQFPISKLKIDRSFICDLPDDIAAASIARALVALGRNMHLAVVAEGVENAAQHAFLRDCDCLAVQGHYTCPALPADRLREFLLVHPQACGLDQPEHSA
ncbi:MAG: EAL domain-containing protein [Gammaproteobacteria bacterium]